METTKRYKELAISALALAIQDLESKANDNVSFHNKQTAIYFIKHSILIDYLNVDRQYLLDKYCKKNTWKKCFFLLYLKMKGGLKKWA